MADPFARLDDAARAKLRERKQPDWLSPTLAVLTDEPFTDPGWIFERKLDGVRTLVFRKGDRVRLRSRNRKSQNGAFPELVEAVARQPCRDFVADGEIVAFRGRRTSFERLQARIGLSRPEEARASGVAVYLYLFDLLHLEGHDLRALPLRQRKRLLKHALRFGNRLRYTPHRNRDGEALLERACEKGWEGLIAKDASSSYAGRRSRTWLKLKCAHGQELVIGGFTPPQGSRRHFGALLVGFHDEDGALRYAGKVGTGYDERTLERLGRRLRGLERKTSPFADDPRVQGARWVTPKLVGEFGFTEWTRDGKLRHPRFLGLRDDKRAEDVRRERPGA
jgi:bifunctional non-homologous end joining protein LigD